MATAIRQGVDPAHIKDPELRKLWGTADNKNGRLTLKGLKQLIQNAEDVDPNDGTVKGKRITVTERDSLLYIFAQIKKTTPTADEVVKYLTEQGNKRAAGHRQRLTGAALDKVTGILTSSTFLRKIKFTLDGIHYNPPEYTVIAKHMTKGHIKVFRQTYSDDEVLQKKANGLYYSTQDEFVITGGEGRPQYQIDSTVVHECTHAIQDAKNMKTMRVLRIEAAAHMAQAIYILTRAESNAACTLYGRLALFAAVAKKAHKADPKNPLTTTDWGKVIEAVATAYTDAPRDFSLDKKGAYL